MLMVWSAVDLADWCGWVRGGMLGAMLTWWVRCFKSPVSVFGVGDCLILPSDLQVAGRSLEKRRAREGMYVKFWFGWHS